MSLATWMREFYPVPAERAATSDVQACEHSLRKWRGVLKTNLKRHGVGVCAGRGADVFEGTNRITFDTSTCALCHLHYAHMCKGCPLYRALGGRSCAGEGEPYDMWLDTSDARPMVAALRKALKLAKEAR